MENNNSFPKFTDIYNKAKEKLSNAGTKLAEIDTKIKTAISNANAALEQKKANEVPTYEQFMTTYFDNLKTNADNLYNQQVSDAELQRQKAVLEAGNQHNSSRAISGANAQALSSMGLTGSGYSQYLDSQAYAQKQGSINAAYKTKQDTINQAQTLKNSAYQQADMLYADYLAEQEAKRLQQQEKEETKQLQQKEKEEAKLEAEKINKNTSYMNIYSTLETLSLTDIERLGIQSGLDRNQIDELKNAKNEQTYASLLARSEGFTLKELDDLVETGKLYYNELRDTDPLNSAYEKLVNKVTRIDASDIEGIFDGKDYVSAKAHLDAIRNGAAEYVTPETMKALQAEFDKNYSAITADITFKKDGGIKDRPGKEGNNLKLEDSDGKVYRVQYNGETLDSNSIHGTIKDGTVFMYKGALYVRVGNTYYGIEARPHNSNYNDLVKKFS